VQGLAVDPCAEIIFIYFVRKKLDPESRRQWSLDQKNALPKMTELIDWLENRALALTNQPSSTSRPTNPPSVPHRPKTALTATQEGAGGTGCPACSGHHSIYSCPAFKSMSLAQRKSCVSSHGLCYNCLGKHLVSACQSQRTCNNCSKQHHTLLHNDSTPQQPKRETQQQAKPPP
jgi:hypothetical protein